MEHGPCRLGQLLSVLGSQQEEAKKKLATPIEYQAKTSFHARVCAQHLGTAPPGRAHPLHLVLVLS